MYTESLKDHMIWKNMKDNTDNRFVGYVQKSVPTFKYEPNSTDHVETFPKWLLHQKDVKEEIKNTLLDYLQDETSLQLLQDDFFGMFHDGLNSGKSVSGYFKWEE